jgi:hypothetical protein
LKKISNYWSLLEGLFTVAYQVVTFYLRFGSMNTDATIEEYLLFFVAGTLGGLILIFFLNKQASPAKRWVVLIAFLLATPLAMIFLLGGGLLGWIGVILFPQIPWALFTWIGSLVSRLVK